MMADDGLVAWVAEALEPLGAVTARKMMGGATLYLDGTIFAIVASEGGLWFKSDAESDAGWDAIGADRFAYTFPDGRTGSMNYRRAPDDVYDDAEAMRDYARRAIEAGLRAPKKAKRGSTRAKRTPPAAPRKR